MLPCCMWGLIIIKWIMGMYRTNMQSSNCSKNKQRRNKEENLYMKKKKLKVKTGVRANP